MPNSVATSVAGAGTTNRRHMAVSFLLGLIVGALALLAGQHLGLLPGASTQNPEQFRRQYTAMMQSRLALRPEQAVQLNTILDHTHERFQQLQTQYRPALQAIRDQQYREIRDMLSEPQRAEYERIRAELARRRKQAGYTTP